MLIVAAVVEEDLEAVDSDIDDDADADLMAELQREVLAEQVCTLFSFSHLLARFAPPPSRAAGC